MSLDRLATASVKRQLLLIHGWGINKAIWSQLEKSLAKDIKVICADLPGYDHSDQIPDPYSLTNLATVLSTYLDQAEETIVLGWSFGGLVAIEMAKLYSDKISRLILVASSPKFIQSADWQFAVEEQVFINFAKELKKDIKKTIKQFIAIQALGSKTAKEDIKSIYRLINQHGYANYNTLNKGLDILLTADQRSVLLSLTMPVLMIAGDRDRLMRVEAISFLSKQKLNRQHNNLSVEIISGAGHAPFISHFNVFESLIRRNLGISS